MRDKQDLAGDNLWQLRKKKRKKNNDQRLT